MKLIKFTVSITETILWLLWGCTESLICLIVFGMELLIDAALWDSCLLDFPSLSFVSSSGHIT